MHCKWVTRTRPRSGAKALIDLDVLRGAEAPLFHVTARIFRSLGRLRYLTLLHAFSEVCGERLFHSDVGDVNIGILTVPLSGNALESQSKRFALTGAEWRDAK